MRILSVVSKVGLVAVALTLVGGCCADQDSKIRELTVFNRELNQKLIDKDYEMVSLKERLQSYENNAKNFNVLLASKDETIRNLQDQVATLQAALDRRNQEYQALVEKMASVPAGRRIPGEVEHLLKQLQLTYPELFTWDAESQRLRFGADVTFDLGSDAVKPRAAEALAKLAAILSDEKAKPILIDIIGHTCNTPIVKPETLARFKTNQELSEGRATSVKSLLTQAAIADSRITTKGMGETQPIAPNDTRDNRAKNRRVEIFLRMP